MSTLQTNVATLLASRASNSIELRYRLLILVKTRMAENLSAEGFCGERRPGGSAKRGRKDHEKRVRSAQRELRVIHAK